MELSLSPLDLSRQRHPRARPPWKAGFQLRYEFLRVSLHKSLTSRKKDKRTEELKFWDDMVNLIKERRKLLMEYQALLHAKRRMNNSHGD